MDEEVALLMAHLHPLRKQKIKESLRLMAHNPLLGKPLQEELKGFFSYRVGVFRIIYAMDQKSKKLHVISIGPRRTIYEDLEKNLRGKN